MTDLAAEIGELLVGRGYWLLLVGMVLAGIVRGFTGFGTAMVYLPFAGQVLPPVWVLVTLLVVDLFGPLPAARRAWADSHPRDLLRLGIGALAGVPLGVMVLTSLSPDAFRYAVSALALLLLVLLVGGARYRGAVTPPLVYTTGGIGGFFGGAVGLPGPPVILLYMARPLPVASIRANILLYLILSDAILLAVFGLRGLLDWAPVGLGAMLILPYLAAVQLGSAVFDPGRETVYRWVAYAIIAASAVMGLPVWD